MRLCRGASFLSPVLPERRQRTACRPAAPLLAGSRPRSSSRRRQARRASARTHRTRCRRRRMPTSSRPSPRRAESRSSQHRRPQHVPGEDQHLPPGQPDDVFTWFAGYRVRFFASKGLRRRRQRRLGESSRLQRRRSSRRRRATTASSTSCRSTYYPWAVLYRKCRLGGEGLRGPEDARRAQALGTKMQGDGLVPIAFADKDGWPAMGTFDILNMRLNGYQFHIDLMARQGVVGRPAGQEGLRHLEPTAPVPPGGRAGPHLAGGRAGLQPRRPACTCSARSWRAGR